jgi:hypothetical protein
MNLNGIDGGEALKQGNKVLIVFHFNFSGALNASWLHRNDYLLGAECFISINASSALMLCCHYFLKRFTAITFKSNFVHL